MFGSGRPRERPLRLAAGEDGVWPRQRPLRLAAAEAGVWPRQRPAFGRGRGRRLAAGERPRRLDALNDAPTHGFTMPNLPDDMDMPDPEEVELLEVVKYGQPRV